MFHSIFFARMRFARFGAVLFLLAIVAALPPLIHAQDQATVPPFETTPPLPAATPRPDGPINIVTSISILADFARQIGGDRVEVNSIAPANADPHDFEPAPDDVVKIENSDLIVLHGLHLDEWANRLVESANASAPVVVASDGVETIGSREGEFDQGDPHIWFDPMRAKSMAANIEQGLEAIDPAGAATYQSRLKSYQDQLDELDQEIAERVALIPEESRKLVTNHDALAYFAERYGFTVIGTVIPGIDSRSEPSAKEVAELLDAIEEAGVAVIFAENTVGPSLAEALASDAGITVAPELYTDSLGDEASGASTYIGLMQTDTRVIVEGLLK